MARRQPRWSPARWEEEGYQAILDLVREREVAPWAEVEARITAGWKDFRKVQPVQLSGARRRLRNEVPPQVIEESTRHQPPVTTLRVAFPDATGDKRRLERLRGARRKSYRRYLSIVSEPRLCGLHAERVVRDSLQQASSDSGLWVPPQKVGHIEVPGATATRGPLDVLAHLLDLESLPIAAEVPLVVEVKNVHSWIYPWTQELWELLVKAAELARQTPVVPLLACPHNSWSTFQLAQDVGFLTCQYRIQLLSPAVDEDDVEALVAEFGLPLLRHEGAYEPIVEWCREMLRRTPPPSPPEEAIPFYRRQAARFAHLASHVLDFDALSGSLPDDMRSSVYRAFKARLSDVAPWPLTGGY